MQTHTSSLSAHGVRIALLAAALSLLPVSASSAQAAAPEGYVPYLAITAVVDGSDWFELTGDQWRWQHRNWDPPEYQEDGTFPTIVNGESFLSTWPGGTANYLEYSDYNTGSFVTPVRHFADLTKPLHLEIGQARDYVALEQTPSLDNGYTLRILFDDDVSPGYDQYSVLVWATPISEPESWAMLLAGLGLLARVARRRG